MKNNSNCVNEAKRTFGKLPARLTPYVFALYMASIMAALMCLIITAVHQGINGKLLYDALGAYKVAMPAAFVWILFVRPLVMALVKRTVSAGN